MGTIIGRQGAKIKQIQDASGVRMVAQKEMLPQSTERIVEVQGTPEGVQRAAWEIGKCLIDDEQRGFGTILYSPVVRVQGGGPNAPPMNGNGYGAPRGSFNRTGDGADFTRAGAAAPSYGQRRNTGPSNGGARPMNPHDEGLQSENISIPGNMVGCIIGRGGAKITDIREKSGARISIAKAPHDETGDRMFTVIGDEKSLRGALNMLYEHLEIEKARRAQASEALE